MKRTVFSRPSEEFHYSITLAGRPAGRERWIAWLEDGLWSIHRETSFAGPIGNWGYCLQISHINLATGLPKRFTERQDNTEFDVFFDHKAGLVAFRRMNDITEKPMTIDMHDPLSLFEMLRTLKPEFITRKISMMNANATIELLREEMIPTHKGEQLAHVYSIYPGPAVVYIQAAEPHEILRFEQWIDGVVLQSSLVSDTFEAINPKMNRKNGNESKNKRRIRKKN